MNPLQFSCIIEYFAIKFISRFIKKVFTISKRICCIYLNNNFIKGILISTIYHTIRFTESKCNKIYFQFLIQIFLSYFIKDSSCYFHQQYFMKGVFISKDISPAFHNEYKGFHGNYIPRFIKTFPHKELLFQGWVFITFHYIIIWQKDLIFWQMDHLLFTVLKLKVLFWFSRMLIKCIKRFIKLFSSTNSYLNEDFSCFCIKQLLY